MHLLLLLAASVAVAGTGCDSKPGGPPTTGGTTGTGSGGNTGLGGSAGGGGTAAPDPVCGVPGPVTSPPYPTDIRFRNDGTTPLYLHTGCIGIDYGISSCASGYRDSLEPTYHCACACDSPSCTSGLSCGQCPAPVALPVAGGTFAKVMWDGVEVTDEDRGTYTCVRSRLVSPGRHRVAVRVFDDEASARDLRGGRIVTQDFDLPSPAGLVEVPLASVQPDPCAGPPSAATPACTGAEARDAACVLTVSMTYGAEGGLVSRSSTSSIAPPARYALTQTFPNSTGMPDQQCMAALPLCARDARVVTTADLTRALTDPIVAASFGANMPVFGYDARPVDGSILVLRRPDGQTVGIGTSSPGAPVPAELLRFQRLLVRLDAQMLGDPACANITR